MAPLTDLYKQLASHAPHLPFSAFILGGLLAVILYQSLSARRKDKLPPGPRGLPFIGNAHQVPKQTPWLTFADWAKQYGDLMYATVVGQPVIIINSRKIANELMDKRSAIYSDRPVLVCFRSFHFCGYGTSFVIKPYGEDWRKQRRLVAQDFAPSTVGRYHGFQEKETRKMMKEMIQDPANFIPRIKQTIGTIIVRVTYGYYVKSLDDPLLATPLVALENFSEATAPGRFLVDIFPILKQIPRWMPGSAFLSIADAWRQDVMDTCWKPYDWCKDNLKTGKTLTPSVVGDVIENSGGSLSKDDEDALVYAASGIFGGGLDTNMSTAMSFFAYMILNPHVQKKAQEEIDSVVGVDRLPTIADRPDLPYVRAIMAEVLRSCPTIPLCIPHSLTQDDFYEGYFLPKGAWIMPNIWQMLHDPEAYPNPMAFKPERYNGDDAEMEKAKTLSFGFGRRICPGRHFAEGTAFSIMATALATCEIIPGLDANGKEVLPTMEVTEGTIVSPTPFPMRLKMRATPAAQLLFEEELEDPASIE
ncbi:putative monooxygenase [Crepidotus variabilis]|uniref:Monooxygenase n=1 Tax=Crepidotus variabilis TaxID=179855 RepID=A0A9P6ED27_9AGAR|nr:putative monooxygenase [Crepidotus variabilis]